MITAMLLIIVMTGCSTDEEPGISQIDWGNKDVRAEQFVTALLNGDYTIAAAGFNEEMAGALSVRQLRSSWLATVRAAGTFIAITEIDFNMHEEYEIYDVLTQHENRNLNTRVVFDEDGQVARLFFSFV